MEDGSGYYHHQGRPAAPAMQQPAPGSSKVGKDDPYFKARKAMFNKFPDDWKRKVTSERDNTKRLLLFENYVKQLKMSEEHQSRQLGLQRAREQHIQQAQHIQMIKQQALQQRAAVMPPREFEELHSNRASPVPPNLYMNPPNGHMPVPANNPTGYRQAKVRHPVIPHSGMKRVHSPNEEYGVRTNVKRSKQEDNPYSMPQEHFVSSPPTQQVLYGQRSPGGTVYLHQKTPGGQVRILPATVAVMGAPPVQNKPLYVQTNSAVSAQTSAQPAVVRKQNAIYRTEQGLRKFNNMGQLSPLGQELSSPASSSSPEGAVRAVPEYSDYNPSEQTRFCRILTPHGVVEEHMQTPSPESVAEISRNTVTAQPNYEIRTEIQSVNSNKQCDLMYNQARSDLKMVVEQQQGQMPPRRTASNPQENLLEDLRQNPEYRAFITTLRDKYSADMKRITARIKIDQGNFPKSLIEIMQILSYKIPLERHEWDSLEERIQKAIEGAGICYPLFEELKRLEEESPEYHCEKFNDNKLSLDPWNICRSQFIHVPQFILDVVGGKQIEEECT